MARRSRVLCVDDNEDVGELFIRTLQARGDLECAGVLTDAMDVSNQVQKREANVVILDLTLPGEEPLDVIRELRRRCPACHVVVYSGREDPSTVRDIMEAGAACFVSKTETISGVLDHASRLASRASGVGLTGG